MKRAIVVLLLISSTAWAHKPSDAQLRLTSDGATLAGRLDVSLRDLDAALGIDTDGNGDITWAEVRAAEPRLAAYVQQRLAFAADGASCPFTLGPGALVDLIDGSYWAVPLTIRCATRPAQIAITYKLLFDLDAQHRGILHVDGNIAVVRDVTPAKLALGPPVSRTRAPIAALAAVWLGVTHVVVVACLILPIAFWRRRTRVQVASAARFVGAFAAGQVVTLALIAAGVIALPAEVVEILLAITTVAVVANVGVRVVELRTSIALELGLLHGFGLAAALARLGAPTALPLRAVIGFQIGVVTAYAVLGAALIAATGALLARRARD